MNNRLTISLDFSPSEIHTIGWCSEFRGNLAIEWSDFAKNNPLIIPGIKKDTVYITPSNLPLNLPYFLADSVPDGYGLRLMDHGMRSLANNSFTPLNRLAWIGSRGLGALTYRPGEETDSFSNIVPFFEAAEMAQTLERCSFEDIPKLFIRAGGSAAGTRPKFWGYLRPDNLTLKIGDGPNNEGGFIPILLKFAPESGEQEEPILEKICLDLAEMAELPVPKSYLLKSSSYSARSKTFEKSYGLAIARFDRVGTQRFHVQTFAAMLNIDFRQSYSLSYESLIEYSKKLNCSDASVKLLIKQMLFNIAMSIRDDHAKNFSFMMGPELQWRPTPAYDLCPHEGVGYNKEHSMLLHNNIKKYKDFTLNDLSTLIKQCKINQYDFEECLHVVTEASKFFNYFADQHGLSEKLKNQWSKRIRHCVRLMNLQF